MASNLIDFTDFFKQFCAPSIPPILVKGRLKDAYSRAKEQQKCLIVYLHCDEHSLTDAFCKFISYSSFNCQLSLDIGKHFVVRILWNLWITTLYFGVLLSLDLFGHAHRHLSSLSIVNVFMNSIKKGLPLSNNSMWRGILILLWLNLLAQGLLYLKHLKDFMNLRRLFSLLEMLSTDGSLRTSKKLGNSMLVSFSLSLTAFLCSRLTTQEDARIRATQEAEYQESLRIDREKERKKEMEERIKAQQIEEERQKNRLIQRRRERKEMVCYSAFFLRFESCFSS